MAGADIFRETRAAVTDAGKNEVRPDAPVEANRAPNFAHIGLHLFAQVRNLVDEGYLGCQHSIGRVFAHFSATAIHHKNRISGAQERIIELLEGLQGLGVVTA